MEGGPNSTSAILSLETAVQDSASGKVAFHIASQKFLREELITGARWANGEVDWKLAEQPDPEGGDQWYEF